MTSWRLGGLLFADALSACGTASYGPATALLFSLPKASARSSAPAHARSAVGRHPPSSPATSAPRAGGPILGSKEKPDPKGPKVRPHMRHDSWGRTVSPSIAGIS